MMLYACYDQSEGRCHGLKAPVLLNVYSWRKRAGAGSLDDIGREKIFVQNGRRSDFALSGNGSVICKLR